MSQYLQPVTAFIITLILSITVLCISADLYFAYSSDICLKEPIFLSQITLGEWLSISGFLNIACLGLLVYCVKKNQSDLMKLCTKIIMVTYDFTSIIFVTGFLYTYLYSKIYCSGNLSKYMLAHIGGSILTIVNGYFSIGRNKYSS